jgi:hypothetical protein
MYDKEIEPAFADMHLGKDTVLRSLMKTWYLVAVYTITKTL